MAFFKKIFNSDDKKIENVDKKTEEASITEKYNTKLKEINGMIQAIELIIINQSKNLNTLDKTELKKFHTEIFNLSHINQNKKTSIISNEILNDLAHQAYLYKTLSKIKILDSLTEVIPTLLIIKNFHDKAAASITFTTLTAEEINKQYNEALQRFKSPEVLEFLTHYLKALKEVKKIYIERLDQDKGYEAPILPL